MYLDFELEKDWKIILNIGKKEGLWRYNEYAPGYDGLGCIPTFLLFLPKINQYFQNGRKILRVHSLYGWLYFSNGFSTLS